MKADDILLENTVLSGLRWNVLLSLLGQLINVSVILALSRLLAPKDYGILAIALAFVGFVDILSGLGSTAAVTQRPTLTDQYLSGVLLVSGGMGTAMVLLVWWVAPGLAAFYNQPELATTLYLLSLLIPLSILQAIPLALLQRKLRFNRIAVITFLSTLLSGLFALYLASRGLAWRALVAKSVMYQFIQTLGFCLLGWPRFSWSLRLSEISDLLRFGVPQSLTQLVFLIGRRLDDVLIGKWLGSASLGIYSMAYSLYLWPLSAIKGRMAEVVFPAFTRLQHDPKTMGYYYLRLVSLTTYIGYPVIIGFLTVSDLAVGLVMGEKWMGVVPILRLLCISSLFEICIFPGAVYQAFGRTDLFLKNTLITRGLAVAGIVVALPFGLSGIAASIAITSLLSFFIYNYLVGQLIPLGNWAMIRVVARGGVFSLVMFGTVAGTRLLLTDRVLPLTELVVAVMAGLFTYALLIYYFLPAIYSKAMGQLKSSMGLAPQAPTV